MSDVKLTGKGAPTRMTKGVVGQHYEDLNNGNIYECLVASEQSKLNGAIGGGYVWKLIFTGEQREDHDSVFGGGGSGGVTSYNDLTDKPCYKEVIRTEIKDQTLQFQNDGGLYMSLFPCECLIPQEGDPVSVVWDGTKYDCTVFLSPAGPAVGNGSLMGPVFENNGMPFLAAFGEGMFMLGTADTSPTHTVSITFEGAKYHTLDNAYLDLPQISDAVYGCSSGLFFIGQTTEEEVASFIRSNRYKKLMDIVVFNPDGSAALRFVIPSVDGGYGWMESNNSDRYDSFDSVIAVGKGYVGSFHAELIERVKFIFTDGVLNDLMVQYKHAYHIRNSNDDLYEITVDTSGQVVATKVTE